MSDKSTSSSSSGGIGFVGLLTILFIALKLLGHITWSWWWVLSPIWISAGLVIAALVLFFVIAGIVMLVKEDRRRKQARLLKADEARRLAARDSITEPAAWPSARGARRD